METKNTGILRHCAESSVLLQSVKSIVYTIPEDSDVNDKFLVQDEGNDHESLVSTNAEGSRPSEGFEGSPGDIDGLCRACANSNNHLVPIFEGEGAQLGLVTKIHKYLPIRVAEDDTLPSQLCYHCAVTIIAFHDIVEGCLEAEQKLLQMQEDKIQKISEEGEAVVAAEHHEIIKDFERVDIEVQEEQVIVETSNDKDDENLQEMVSVTAEIERSPMRSTSTTQRVLRRTVNTKNTQKILTTMTTTTQTRSIPGEDSLTENEDDPPSCSEPQRTPELSSNSQKTCRRASQRPQTYPCMHCNFTSKRKKSLSIHMYDCHPKQSEITKKHSTINKECIEAAKMEVEGKIYYHCKECGKNLFSPYTFSWHMRIHTGERPFTCHLCGKQFRVNQGLARHLKETHARIKNFPCDICNRMFATKRNADDHRRIHTGERPYICNVCGKTFKQKASLFVHNRTHNDIFPFKCNYCDQMFRTRPALMVHVTKHTGEKPHLCDICGRAFRIKYELKRHRLIHSDEKPWECADCGVGFRQKRYLVNHRKCHGDTAGGSQESEETKNISRLKVQKAFKNLTSAKPEASKPNQPSVTAPELLKVLSQDLLSSPSETPPQKIQKISPNKRKKETSLQNSKLKSQKPFTCHTCNRIFKVKAIYECHLKEHEGQKLFTCHVCGKQFGQTGSLYYHLKHVHDGVKNHACDICGRCFAMKTAMQDHRRIHTGERPYVCDTCGKTFKTKAALYIHSKIHSDQFPYKCSYCNKLFRFKQQMLGHVTTHTGIKNHTCDTCGKSFGVKWDLTRHLRVHLTDKPFVCAQCGMSFAQKRYLTSHERSKHNRLFEKA